MTQFLQTMLIFSNDSIESLYTSIIKIVAPTTPIKVYKSIVEEAVNLIGASYGSIFIAHGKELRRVYSTIPSNYQVAPRSNGYSHRAFRKREIYVLGEREIRNIHPEMATDGTKSLIILPLAYRNKSLGVLTLRSKRVFYFDKRKVDILKLFVSVAGIKVRNSYLLELTNKQLKFRKEFSALASHELKTPLTIISLYSDQIERKVRKGQKVNPEAFRTVQTQIDKMARIIDEFLTTKRSIQNKLVYKWEEHNVYILLKQILNNYKVINPNRKINLQVDEGSKKAKIRADRHKLQEVFMNILNNAIKFSTDDSLISVYMQTKSDRIMLNFNDQGVGIRKSDLPYLFDPFYKGKGIKKAGTGIGLYLSKNIINAHGGMIKVVSKFRKGTTLMLEFPIAQDNVSR